MYTVEEKGLACISVFFTGNKQNLELTTLQKRKKKQRLCLDRVGQEENSQAET